MKLLDRYLGRAVIGGTLIVLLALTALAAFFNLIGEAKHIGQGSYGLSDALLFMLLNMPRQAYEMFAVAVLLGAMLGLGNLAGGNELTVMRAAGISILRLGGAALSGGLVLALFCVLLGEVLAPPAERYAQYMREQALYERAGIGSAQGIWMREGDSFINIRRMGPEGGLRDVHTYRFADKTRLLAARQARAASHLPDTGWILQGVEETRFRGGELKALSRPREDWSIHIARDTLDLFVVDSETLSSLELWRYSRYLAANGLDTTRYATAFWNRVVTPFSVLVMAALALPFVFGPMRSAGVGQRMIFGLLIGIAFYVVNQTLANSGQVFGLPAVITAWVPTLVLAAITLVAIRRTT